ncbi:MAG: type II restriction endonuclease [Bacilli bacterium]
MEYIRLNQKDKEDFYKIIKELRKKNISSAVETANIIFDEHRNVIKEYIESKNISELIVYLREKSYDYFLFEEANFNREVILYLGSELNVSKEALKNAVKGISKLDFSSERIDEYVNSHFSNYAATIYPYLYELSLSNTNSRRSRSGKTFESIIYELYEYLNYPYDSQTKIGKVRFSEMGLGKVVDSILPNQKSFTQFRNKCIVGSMKTSLRERWQEVVEEVQRSNLPNIYLLTVDEKISSNKIQQMAHHNIVLVTLQNVKEQLSIFHNVISFEEYFLVSIPEILTYWEDR